MTRWSRLIENSRLSESLMGMLPYAAMVLPGRRVMHNVGQYAVHNMVKPVSKLPGAVDASELMIKKGIGRLGKRMASKKAMIGTAGMIGMTKTFNPMGDSALSIDNARRLQGQ